MTANTKIEWADHTFNPWIGCTKVSPGCDHCYAEAMMDLRYGKARWGTGQQRVRTSAANWKMPLRWNSQAAREGRRFRVFCASLADWLDNEAATPWLVDLLELIRITPHLDWLLLSKRIGNWSARISEAIGYLDEQTTPAWPLPLRAWLAHWLDGDDAPAHVWVGATVVNQDEAERDVPKLLRTHAAKRFVSVEPMLGPVDLSTHRGAKGLPLMWEGTDADGTMPVHCGLTGRYLGEYARRGWVKTSENASPWLDWVIVGGESGAKARPMHPGWARSLRDQCASAGVAFFFKQWGEHAPNWLNDDAGNKIDGSEWVDRMGKKYAGRLLDGIEHNDTP